MSPRLPIYLATLRKEWGLSQEELAHLLSMTASGLSRVESRERRPTTDILLASEVVFGKAARHVFPGLYGEVEDRVMAQARVLYERLECRKDIPAKEKLAFLKDMIARAEADEFRL